MQDTEEIWKDIPGYEGLYQVSSMGRVKRLPIRIKHSNGIGTRLIRERIIKPSLNAANGYYNTCLSKNGIKTSRRINVLVANVFIPNPLKKPQVGHIDHVKTNNCVTNLEWCTASENKLHSIKAGRVKKTHSDGVIDSSKAEQIRDLAIAGYKQIDIAKKFKTDQSNISRVINRKRRYRYI